MALTFDCDPAEAAWLSAGSATPHLVIERGPQLHAHARLLFCPDPIDGRRRDVEVEGSDDERRDDTLVRDVAAALTSLSRSGSLYYFCIWDGYGDLPSWVPVTVGIGGLRRYALAHGSLEDWATRKAALGLDDAWPPAFMWPDDRRWCVTSDVDPPWAVIGGEEAMVGALLRSPVLPLVSMEYADDLPSYS